MKIRRLYESTEEDVHYEVREYTDVDEFILIPAEEAGGYVHNYDPKNLEDVINFYFEGGFDKGEDFRVIKITEDHINAETLKMMKDANKYNL